MISGKLDQPREFGRYTLIARVASGGMATVFRAEAKPGDELEGRPIAIKVLHEHLAENPEFIRMFKDEGRIVRDLDHPNVVHVFEVGEFEGSHYLAMEFIDGRDLGQVLLAHRLNHVQVPSPVAFEILRQSLVALRYVHDYKGNKSRSQGIVHRDVSPQNLLISREPLIKLTDFGIARGDHRSDRTRTGTIKGKMHYMAPEQASGERVDARADLYAMGAVAYEMLTGQPLFGPGTTEVLHARAVRGDFEYGPKFERLPEDVKTWLKRSLQTSPDMRFQSADAMLAAMENLAKASRAHYKPEVLVKLLDMEDARRSKQKEKNQRLIIEDAVSSGRIQPGMVMQSNGVPPKVVPTGARVELDASQRVSRLGNERNNAKIDWNAKQDVQMRPVTAVRDLGPKISRVHVRSDLMPAEAAMGKSYAPASVPQKAVKGAHVEALTPGSLASPRPMDDDLEMDAPPPPPKAVKPKRVPQPVQEQPGLALASAVAWSCAALLLFAVTQELTGAQLKLPEAQDLRVASLWEDDAPPTRTDAVARSGPHAQPPKRDVAKQQVRKTVLPERDAGSHEDTQLTAEPAAPAVPVRKVAGGVLPDMQVPAEEKEKEAKHAEVVVAQNAERVAWEGRPVEHVERPGMPERGEKSAKATKPVTMNDARGAIESAAKLGYVIAGMPNLPVKAKRAVPADAAAPVVAAAPKAAPVVPKPVAAAPKPVVAVAKNVAPAAKAQVVVAKMPTPAPKASPVVGKPASPVVVGKGPVVAPKAAAPVVAPKAPAVVGAKPVVAAAKPVAQGAKPAVAPVKAPVVGLKPSVPVKPVAPVAKPVVPAAKGAAPVAKPGVVAPKAGAAAVAKPVVKAVAPVAKPAAVGQKPALKPIAPAVKAPVAAAKPAAPAKPAVAAAKPTAPVGKPAANAKPVVPAKPGVAVKPAPAKPVVPAKPVSAAKAAVVPVKSASAVAKKAAP